MDIDVLITTMHQCDFSIYDKMNIQTNAVIANQTDYYKYEEKVFENSSVKFISTKTRGLSRNRNIALGLSQAKYVLFADDDMRFVDNYEEIIEKEFKLHPEADAIKFYVENVNSDRQLSWTRPKQFTKATRRNVSSSGVVALVIKREILMRHNLYFHENYGSGTLNYCGEDTIFLQTLINKKVVFFISPTKISEISQGESTWFNGYNSDYFYTVGKVLSEIYPLLSRIIVIRSAYKFSKNEKCSLSFREILKNYYLGIKSNK